jgi:hypothetical protein
MPQPLENIQSSSPRNPIETVTTLTKNMKLNINKTLEEQGYLLKNYSLIKSNEYFVLFLRTFNNYN